MLFFVKRLIGGRYPIFHSTCDEETGYIREMFGEEARVVQIPNFIEIPKLAERTPGKYFLFLGRVAWKKGIENLIEALAINPEFRNSDYTLKIAGTGLPSYEKKLHDLVAERGLEDKIEFLGQVVGEEKQKLLAGAFWTLMPSLTENFGLVVLESLAQNTPVLASKGSPWQVLEAERLGMWTDNSPEELSAAITRMIRMDPKEYEEYRSRGRAFVEDNYDVSRNIGVWTEIYRGMK